MKNNQFGKSMIEMLSVLTIIGVLSVGGITGYSKAMEKYKLNRTFNDFTMLINETMPFSQQFMSYSAGTDLLPILRALDLIPNSFEDKDCYLYDPWHNQFWALTCISSPCWKFYYKFTGNNSVNTKLCYEIVSFMQNFHKNIYRISTNGNYLWGSTHCTSNNNCLLHQNIQQIYSYCNNYCNANCVIEVGFE